MTHTKKAASRSESDRVPMLTCLGGDCLRDVGWVIDEPFAGSTPVPRSRRELTGQGVEVSCAGF
jgi:hypothetical protein